MNNNILSALKAIPVSDLTYSEWISIGMAIKNEGFSCAEWDDWSRNDIRYHPGECESKWSTFSDCSNPVTGGTIIQLAKKYGWTPPIINSEAILDWDDEIEYDCDTDCVTYMPVSCEVDPVHHFKTYIEALFEPNEYVRYVTNDVYEDKDGKRRPLKGVFYKTARGLLDSLEKHQNDLGATIGDWKPEAGAWVSFNPLDGKGIKKENVTRFTYALVESDTLSIEEQNKLYRESKLPIKLLIFSGGKSLHAIVKVDATCPEEYENRVRFLFEYLKETGIDIDQQNKNPNRLSRLPGATRNGKMQYIVDKDIGCASWAEWVDHVEGVDDSLPEIVQLSGYTDNPPKKPEELIQGILRLGHKMLISSSSKAGKSFLLMELCISIAEGIKWLGFQCMKGRILYLNLEIDAPSCIDRFFKIYEALKIPKLNLGNIEIWNLRGHAEPLDQLVPKLIHRIRNRHYDAIFIDPIYKVITGDENSASAMGAFCNQFDKICDATGASVIYCHHHSKGSQGAKKAMDRASGSGVFARDPDAQLDVIELELSDDLKNNVADNNATAWRMESSLREFANITPVNFWFEFPLHRLDDDGLLKDLPPKGTPSAGKLKNPSSKSTKDSENEFRTAYEACNINGTVTVQDMMQYLNVSDKTIYARIKKMNGEFQLHNGIITRT